MPDNKAKKVIVIDVGYGAVPYGSAEDKTYGAVNGFDTGYKIKFHKKEVTEFQVSIKNAELLRKFLIEKGFEVHLTTDKGERGKKIENAKNFGSRFYIAKKYNADLYISMHANAQTGCKGTTEGDLSGPLIFTDFKINQSSEFLRENKAVYLDSLNGKIDFLQPEQAKEVHYRLEPANKESYYLMQKLQLLMKDKGYSHRGKTNILDKSREAPLRGPDNKIPRILIEAGFMTNANDLQNLVESSDKIKAMFETIAETIKTHFDEKDKPKKVEKKSQINFHKILNESLEKKIYTEAFVESVVNPFKNSNDM